MKLELTEDDRRSLQNFVTLTDAGEPLENVDFYDVSSVLDRVLKPSNRVDCVSYEEYRRRRTEESGFLFPDSFRAAAIVLLGNLVAIGSEVIGIVWIVLFNNATFEVNIESLILSTSFTHES